MPENKKPPKRQLTSEERAAWREATRLAKKLAHVVEDEDAAEMALPTEPKSEYRSSAKKLDSSIVSLKRNSRHGVSNTQLKPLVAGALADMDGALAARFKKGALPIEATLDLHGHTRDSADIKLEKFILRAHGAGKRMLLVITGRGARSKREDGEQGGVIKQAVARWLGEGSLRSYVLAFTAAQPKDGGAGAFYVLLKRKR